MWYPQLFNKWLSQKYKRTPITNLVIKLTYCSKPYIINEILDIILNVKGIDKLESLELSGFPQNAELDTTLLNNLAQNSVSLQKLTVKNMDRANEEA